MLCFLPWSSSEFSAFAPTRLMCAVNGVCLIQGLLVYISKWEKPFKLAQASEVNYWKGTEKHSGDGPGSAPGAGCAHV